MTEPGRALAATRRLPLPSEPLGPGAVWRGMLVAGLAAGGCALAWADDRSLLLPAGALAAGVVALAIFRLGGETPLLALLALVALFPVTTIGGYAGVLGGGETTARTAFVLTAVVAAVLVRGGTLPRPPAALRPVASALVLLAGVGVVVALANAAGGQGAVSIAAQLAGQPLLFALLLGLLADQLRSGRPGVARDRMLIALSIGIIGEGILVGVELASGAAYDELREFTRAQGTVGADFIGTLGTIGVLVGCAEYVRARRWNPLRVVGVLTIVASLVILSGAVARAAVIAVLIGGAYVVLSDPRYRPRALLVGGCALLAIAASALTPVGELWTSRLDARTVQSFDRPATWVSGLRIGIDHVWTGASEAEITRGIDDVRYYRQTPFGDTGVVPHNVWILSFAQGGIAALLVLGAATLLLVRALRAPPGGRSTEERFYVGALLGVGAVALVNNVFTHPELMIPVLALIALVVCREDGRREDARYRLAADG